MNLYCSQHINMAQIIAERGLIFDNGYMFENFQSRPAFRFFSASEDIDNVSGLKTIYEVDIDGLEIAVCEGALEAVSQEKFYGSAVSLRDYKFGRFIKPVYFCFSYVPVEKMSIFSGNDGLRFFESNAKFYVECLFQKMKEKYPNFELYAVRSCLEALAGAGKLTRTENGNYIIFEDVNTGEIIPVCKKFMD